MYLENLAMSLWFVGTEQQSLFIFYHVYTLAVWPRTRELSFYFVILLIKVLHMKYIVYHLLNTGFEFRRVSFFNSGGKYKELVTFKL